MAAEAAAAELVVAVVAAGTAPAATHRATALGDLEINLAALKRHLVPMVVEEQHRGATGPTAEALGAELPTKAPTEAQPALVAISSRRHEVG